jgi:inorganic pyrophosphatase
VTGTPPGAHREADFWSVLRALFEGATLVIDRPRGSRHPRFAEFVYPVDYGYLEGTSAGDGNGIDVFRGSSGNDTINGICCTVDALKHDAEIKILYACTHDEIGAIQRTLNGGPIACFIVINPRRAGTEDDIHFTSVRQS